MTPWELTQLRDSYLHAARNDADDLGEWAKENVGTLILVTQQALDALAFWVNRCDRFEAKLPVGLPSVDHIQGIASWSYAVGRALIPETPAKREDVERA